MLWGIISLTAYATVFMNEKTVISYFAAGGYMAVLAIMVTALVFSLVHGTFAHYVVEIIGLEANCVAAKNLPQRSVHARLDNCEAAKAPAAAL